MSAVDDIAAYLAYLKIGGNSIDQIIFDELPNGEEMNATDELRRLLDERGVEWRKAPHYSGESQDNETIFEGNGIEWYTNDHMNGRLGLRALRYEVTPQQAVEATLGREPDDAAMVKLHERMNAALLEYERAQGIEMRDGDAAVTVPFVAKMHELLEEAATLGRGELLPQLRSEGGGRVSDVSDLKAEVLALRAENSELRKHVKMPDEPLEIDEKDFYVRAFIKWATEEQPEVKRLEAENDKLRELVRDMWTCILTADKSDNAWDECPRCILWNGNNNHRCEFNRRMKELGVDA